MMVTRIITWGIISYVGQFLIIKLPDTFSRYVKLQDFFKNDAKTSCQGQGKNRALTVQNKRAGDAEALNFLNILCEL